MATAADAEEEKSYEITVVEATGVPRVPGPRIALKLGKDIAAYVQIDTAKESKATSRVSWIDGGELSWGERFTL
ncbi:hypothetical protein HWV62_32019 [Athelia sp. TMB]|nr:hypothetical protein HWV62_32019 [Athelia sp. TMB]